MQVERDRFELRGRKPSRSDVVLEILCIEGRAVKSEVSDNSR